MLRTFEILNLLKFWFISIFDFLEFVNKIEIDFSLYIPYLQNEMMPFCSEYLSILNDVPILKTMPAGEIETTRDNFVAIVFFYQELHFEKA